MTQDDTELTGFDLSHSLIAEDLDRQLTAAYDKGSMPRHARGTEFWVGVADLDCVPLQITSEWEHWQLDAVLTFTGQGPGRIKALYHVI